MVTTLGVLLTAGFFVCGFHVAFITVHFPAYVRDLGLSASVGAGAIAVIGLFNIIGSFAAGAADQRWRALLHEYPLRVGRRGPNFSGPSAGATLQG